MSSYTALACPRHGLRSDPSSADFNGLPVDVRHHYARSQLLAHLPKRMKFTAWRRFSLSGQSLFTHHGAYGLGQAVF